MWYEKLDNNWVQCKLCFRECKITPNGRGFCTVRKNINGSLYSLVYGKVGAMHVDPIEKEPLLHYYPGSEIFCISTAGCSFRCKFCQNWHISQVLPEDIEYYELSPEEVVKLAKKYNCIGISHTYAEPTVWYEYLYDIAKIAKKEGIKNIIHTAGPINPEPLKKLLPLIDAVSFDLKGFNQKIYGNAIPDANLEHILKTLKIIKESGVWVEITNLVIPTFNDDTTDIRKMCEWIKENLGSDVPLHFSRFFPHYKMKNLPPTPIETLEKAKEIANNVGLKYITIGNVPGHKYNSTYCPNCGKIVIKRTHFAVLEKNIKNGRCKFCQTPIPGVWE